jgi:hypothetical protein
MGRLANLGVESNDAVYMGRGMGYYGSRIRPLWLVVGIRNRAPAIRNSEWTDVSGPRESLDTAAEVFREQQGRDDYAGIALVCVSGIWGGGVKGPNWDGNIVRTAFMGPVYSETHQIAGGRQLPNVLGLEAAVTAALVTAFPDWKGDMPPDQPLPKNMSAEEEVAPVHESWLREQAAAGMTVPPVEHDHGGEQ